MDGKGNKISPLQERNKQDRRELPKTESYIQTKPINDRLAFAFLVIAGICGIIIGWAAADSPPHYTTIKAAGIIAIAFSILAVCFHWIPTKKEIEDPDALEMLEDVTTQMLPISTSDALEAILISPDREPQPNVFEVECDRLSKENVLLKIEKERLLDEVEKDKYKTTELPHDNPFHHEAIDEIKEGILLAIAQHKDSTDINIDLMKKNF